MDNFNFYNPVRVLFGEATIPQIGRELKNAGIKKVLLLAGGGSIKSNGVYDTAIKSLRRAGIEWVELWGVRPNPTLEHALKGIEICRSNGLESILAIGGGSVIDEAKSIAAGFYLDDLWEAFEGNEKINNALPLYTILTISATCSEMNMFAVLSNEEQKKKWAIRSEYIFPKISIIDPGVQMSLPWRQTLNGGIDAISHTMEFYFLGTNQEISISIDEAIINTLIKSIDMLQNDEKNYNARANLAWSSALALNGVSGASMRGGDWAVHNIEHSISVLYPEVAHAEGLSVIYPAWILYMQENNKSQFERWAKNIWGADSVEKGVEMLKNKYKSWGAPVSLRELHIAKEVIPDLATNAMIRGEFGILKKLNYNDVINILELAF